jgi:predicted Zn-dependent peptidase
VASITREHVQATSRRFLEPDVMAIAVAGPGPSEG